VLTGRGGNDDLKGYDGDDRLESGGGDDLLRGCDGSDVLLGGGDSDILRGGGGADALFGNAGNDDLDGEDGDDDYTGGNGADRFLVEDTPGDHVEEIFDFSGERQGDELILDGYSVTTSEQFVEQARDGRDIGGGPQNDTVLRSDGDKIILYNVSDEEVANHLTFL
jgi:Ca2+-binding RTX toxin-like protein